MGCIFEIVLRTPGGVEGPRAGGGRAAEELWGPHASGTGSLPVPYLWVCVVM